MPPAGLFLRSPYEVEARDAKKQTTSWVGYTVHVTETCDDAAPPRMPHVEPTAGPGADGAVTPRMPQALERQGLLPAAHIVDTGSLDAELLVTSQREYGSNVRGPTRANDHWRAQAAPG
jgi:transposase